MTYTRQQKHAARVVLGIVSDEGRPVPIEERSNETLRYTIEIMRGNHKDLIAEMTGGMDALRKRLKSHRNAKKLANQRADIAVKAMQDMLKTFEKDTS